MLQHKCCVQFEHCLFEFSVFTGNIFIWIPRKKNLYQFSIKKLMQRVIL